MSEEIEKNTGAEELLNEAELAEKTGETVSHDSKHLIHCLNIIGQIEGHYALPEQNKATKYEHIIPALVAIEQDRSVEGLLIILNTVGGIPPCMDDRIIGGYPVVYMFHGQDMGLEIWQEMGTAEIFRYSVIFLHKNLVVKKFLVPLHR